MRLDSARRYPGVHHPCPARHLHRNLRRGSDQPDDQPALLERGPVHQQPQGTALRRAQGPGQGRLQPRPDRRLPRHLQHPQRAQPLLTTVVETPRRRWTRQGWWCRTEASLRHQRRETERRTIMKKQHIPHRPSLLGLAFLLLLGFAAMASAATQPESKSVQTYKIEK